MILKHKYNYVNNFLSVCLIAIAILGYTPTKAQWQNVHEEGAFSVYRRQSLIGEEKYTIISNSDSIVIKSKQTENERGRITGDEAELHLKMD